MGEGHAEPRTSARSTILRPDATHRWDPPVSEEILEDAFPAWLDHDRYRRESRLGAGGMGVVYGYRDPRLDRLVAVKTLPPEWARNPAWRERFEQEAQVLAALDHPNIARINHIAEHDGIDYLILEYVPGRTIDRHLGGSPMPVPEALAICQQVAAAIAAGHSGGIVHRDIKPGNIMITPAGTAKLLDFGIAYRASDPQADTVVSGDAAPTAPAGRTEAGRVMGTPGYMSPEQATGHRVDARADIWAFGCVAMECLTGHPVFPGPTGDERIDAALRRDPDFDLLPEITPSHVRDVLVRCLEKDPARRPATILEVHDTFEQVVDRLPRGRGAVPHNLPSSLSSYVPRRGEIAGLRDALRGSRLVTLTGPGGGGKTRLAVKVATELRDDGLPGSRGLRFGDGIFFIELASTTAAEHIPGEIASALGDAHPVPSSGGASMLDGIIETLRSRDLLLIMDNCEHLLEGCAALLTPLLGACPDLSVIATSRAVLGVAGEQAYHVPALSFPRGAATVDDVAGYEAVQLFLARARQAQSEFRLTGRNAAAVGEICRRLEGMPLAIELAAARLRSLPVSEVASHLFELLDADHVLESSIASSVDLLTPPQRELLGRLTVFRGGWTLEAAETICADPGGRAVRDRAVIELLSQLVDCSLVQYEVRHDRARYHLLETVREYGRQHLWTAAEAGPILDRHLEWAAALAREADRNADGDEQIDWFDRLEIEHDNLRAALDHCLAGAGSPDLAAHLAKDLHVFWYVHGHLDEARTRLNAVLERRGAARDLLQIQTLNAIGTIAQRQRNFDAASVSYGSALEMARALDDRRRTAGLLTNLGIVDEEREELAASRAHHEEAMTIYEDLGDDEGVAFVQLNLGALATRERRDDEADALLGDCLAVFERTGDSQRIAAAHQNLGELAHRAGRSDDAWAHYREALIIRHELHDHVAMAMTLTTMAIVLADDGRPEAAARLVGLADSMRSSTDGELSGFTESALVATRRRLRETLERAVLRSAMDEGRTMSEEQGVAEALEARPR